MVKLDKIKVKEAVAVVEKAHVFLEPDQDILKLAHGAVTELQKPSNKSNSKKVKVAIDFAKKATKVAADASKKHKQQKQRDDLQHDETQSLLPPRYYETDCSSATAQPKQHYRR